MSLSFAALADSVSLLVYENGDFLISLYSETMSPYSSGMCLTIYDSKIFPSDVGRFHLWFCLLMINNPFYRYFMVSAHLGSSSLTGDIGIH